MEKDTTRILYEIYTMLVEMKDGQAGEDYPSYDLDKVIDKVKNHLDYYIGVN